MELKELRVATSTLDSAALLVTFAVLYEAWDDLSKELYRVWDLKKRKKTTVNYQTQEETIRTATWAASNQMFEILKVLVNRAVRHKDWEYVNEGDKRRPQHKRATRGHDALFYAASWQNGIRHGTIEVLIYENRHHSDPLTKLILEW